MQTDPLESLDALPKGSNFETERFAGVADSLEGKGYPDLGLEESTRFGAGIDTEEDGAFTDDLRSQNKESDLDKAATV